MSDDLKNAWLCVTGSIIAAFMVITDIQITNAAIEKIQNALMSTVQEGSWIASSYLIAELIMIPVTGMLIGLLGLRRHALSFCALFIFSSVLCTQAWNLNSMIALRFFQGLTGGALIPLAYIIIVVKLPTSHHAKAMACFGVASAIGPAFGPAIAGSLTERFGWESLFLINIPIGLIALYLMNKGLGQHDGKKKRREPLDLIGFILIAAGLSSLQILLEEGYNKGWFASDFITLHAVIAAVCISAFVINASFLQHPLVKLHLLKNLHFSIACAANVIAGSAIVSCLFLIPFYLITVLDYSPTQIADVILWMSVSSLLMVPVTTLLIPRVNHAILISIGFSIFAVSAWMCSQLTIDFGYSELVLPQLLRGMAIPLMMMPLGILAIASIDKAEAASGSILFNIFRTLGGAIGVSGLTSYVNTQKDLHFLEYTSVFSPEQIQSNPWFAGLFLPGATTHFPLQADKTMMMLYTFDQIERQSYVLAFNDAFELLGLMLVCTAAGFLLIFKGWAMIATPDNQPYNAR